MHWFSTMGKASLRRKLQYLSYLFLSYSIFPSFGHSYPFITFQVSSINVCSIRGPLMDPPYTDYS